MSELNSAIQQLQSLQLQIKEHIAEKWTTNKKVVFMVYKASCWNAMESVWRAAMADPDYDVYVIALPWYYRNYEGGVHPEIHCEGDLLPSYVPVTSYKDFNFSIHHPYLTIIQNPYDHYNYTTIVDPRFSSHKLKANSEHLVYIPWFTTDEINFFDPEDGKAVFNMRYYVTVPGVVHADMTIVQSEQMRKTYIEVLSEFAGEETRPRWESSIFGFGSPIFEKDSPDQESNIWSKLKMQLESNVQKENTDEIR